MGQNDPGLKRLQIILVLFIFILCFNGLQAIFLHDSSDYEDLTGSTETGVIDESPTATSNPLDWLGIAFNFIGFFFGGFLLTLPTLSVWINVILLPIYLITLLAFWYLVIDFIKDITVLGSHL